MCKVSGDLIYFTGKIYYNIYFYLTQLHIAPQEKSMEIKNKTNQAI